MPDGEAKRSSHQAFEPDASQVLTLLRHVQPQMNSKDAPVSLERLTYWRAIITMQARSAIRPAF